MRSVHDIARALKAKTDAGALLLLDGNVYNEPDWIITPDEISFGRPGFRIMLWDRAGEWGNTKDARKSLKTIRVLVDA
jgi:hypothetical protein